MTTTSMRAASSSSASACRRGAAVAPRLCRGSVVCQAQEQRQAMVDRRSLMLGGAASLMAGGVFSMPAVALADEAAASPYTKMIGYATPPTSYGGYGGNAAETPRYTFEYPSNWKTEVPNKTEKGTQGVDTRVVAPRSKGETKAFVISLTRAGEDNARFRLTDLDSTLSSFAGADYDLQDAISGATNKTTARREDANGVEYYEYDIDSPEYRYLSSIAVKNGKVFALFVRSPARAFKANEEALRHIVTTFNLL